MHKKLCTKVELIDAFLTEAAARGIRGKTSSLCAAVIEHVHPDEPSNWGLETSGVEAHNQSEMESLIKELQAKLTCSEFKPSQFI